MRLFRSIPLISACLFLAVPVLSAQVSPSVSSSSDAPTRVDPTPQRSAATHSAVERGGSAVSLETSESMFDVAAALNACGYDNGLETSLPVRAAVRADMAAAIAETPQAAASRDKLCAYVNSHSLRGAQNLAQYVSLGLFLTPPPELTPAVPESELPPDSLQVIGVLPLLRDFAQQINLHAIYARHRAGMEAAVDQAHDSITRMLLETNAYLHQPVSSYDGRRFLVLLEPMLSPQAVNARIYGTDYFIVTSPAAIDPANPPRVSPGSRMTVSARAAGLQMDQIRHIYLLYNVDPIIYARAGATNRLLPILKTVQDAPIDFNYKNDIVALTTECLIKAIEARTMDVAIPRPPKPSDVKQRTEIDNYNQAIIDYDRKAEAVRRRQVLLDMESGWVLTGSFYDKLATEDREGVSLQESIGEMVYGMDVPAEVSAAKKIPFFAPDSTNIVAGAGVNRARAPRVTLTAMDKAELALQKGDRMGAEELADKELKTNPTSGAAMYVIARVRLMQGEPQEAFDTFTKIVSTSKDPRTVAWSHIYLGRLYDTQQQPNRSKAVAEYRAAMAVPGAQADVVAAAAAGIRTPFAPPKRAVQESDDEELDPTGRKQKESYRPTEEVPPPATTPHPTQ